MYGKKIAIASGKGGTGKTLFATNLAYVLSNELNTHLVDCDVEEPNSNLFYNFSNISTEVAKTLIPIINKNKCTKCSECVNRCMFNSLALLTSGVVFFEDTCHSCGSCIVACKSNAITEGFKELGTINCSQKGLLSLTEGRLKIGQIQAPELIEQTLKKINKGNLTIIDSPPGTSCATIAAVKDSDLCILVTEPNPFGLHDLKLAVEMAKALGLKVAVVINKYRTNDSEVERYCNRNKLDIIGTIPLSKEIALLYANGKLITKESDKYYKKFKAFIRKIERLVNSD